MRLLKHWGDLWLKQLVIFCQDLHLLKITIWYRGKCLIPISWSKCPSGKRVAGGIKSYETQYMSNRSLKLSHVYLLFQVELQLYMMLFSWAGSFSFCPVHSNGHHVLSQQPQILNYDWIKFFRIDFLSAGKFHIVMLIMFWFTFSQI